MNKTQFDAEISEAASEMFRIAKPITFDLMMMTERHGPVVQAIIAMLFAVATAKNLAEAVGAPEEDEWAAMVKTMSDLMRGNKGALQ